MQLNSVPKGARLFVDDIPASSNPIELARDGKNRVIKVTAPGKAPWQAVHHASANATFEVFMVPLESAQEQRERRAGEQEQPERARIDGGEDGVEVAGTQEAALRAAQARLLSSDASRPSPSAES